MKTLDLHTQERVRQIAREQQVMIAEADLAKPIHMVAVWKAPLPSFSIGRPPISAPAAPQWILDLGHCHVGVDEQKALTLKHLFNEEEIPFWHRNLGTYWLALQTPNASARELAEIREAFGNP